MTEQRLSPGLDPAAPELTSRQRLFVALALLIGAALRAWRYAGDHGLWLDEILLAANIESRTFAELTRSLDDYQFAPMGFLFAQKASVTLLGPTEYAHRLFPFVCSLFALFFFWRLCVRCLKGNALVIAVCLFALSAPLLSYAAQGKKYTIDAAVATLLLWLAVPCVLGEAKWGHWVALLVVGAVSLGFSFPAIFVLAGIGMALGIKALTDRDWSRTPLLILVAAVWLGIFAATFQTSGSEGSTHEGLRNWWSRHFFPFPPTSVAHVQWYIDFFFRTFAYPLGEHIAGLTAFAWLIGLIAFLRTRMGLLLMFLLPMALTLGASALSRYPLYDRLLLFWIPGTVIFVAVGSAEIVELTRARSKLLSGVFLTLLLGLPALQAAKQTISPYRYEETRGLTRHLDEHYQPGDLVFVNMAAMHAYEYYSGEMSLDTPGFYRLPTLGYWGQITEQYEAMEGQPRVWIYLSHLLASIARERDMLTSDLNRRGTVVEVHRAADSELYLYDMTRPPPADGDESD